jgi:uncharacterized protein
VLVTYAVPPAVLEPFVPPGCELDTIGGDAFVSLVAFDFLDTRVGGVGWPGFVNFSEINLRFYVRHRGVRGVAFIAEFVRQPTIVRMARLIYNEPYRAASMSSRVHCEGASIVVDHKLALDGETYRLRVDADATRVRPGRESIEHFFKEHEWGFGTSRGGRLIRYHVEHAEWDVHPVRSFELNWNWRKIYGEEFAFLQDVKPYSVMLAAGSAVRVFPKRLGRADMGSRPTVLFDGVCELCNRSVKFVSDRDPQGLIQFVPMQSEAGGQILREHHLDPKQMSTVVMIDRGRAYTQSTAVLRILRRLRRPEAWAMVGIPRPVRDVVYDWIARNRYRWFGKYEACQLPPE